MAFTNTKIIDFGGGGWKSRQVDNPCAIPNAKDSSKLVMLFNGMDGGGIDSIGKASADASDIRTWTEYGSNPIIGGSGNVGGMSGYCRVGAPVLNPVTDEYWIYLTNGVGAGSQIYLVKCPTGADGYSSLTSANMTVANGGSPVLTFGGTGRTDEICVEDGFVYRKDATHWYMYYSYRTGSATLPGIRVATSSDGVTWTKVTGADLFTAIPGAYYEFHQVQEVGSTLVMAVECGLNAGARWQTSICYSTDPVTGWVQMPMMTVDQTRWSGYTSDPFYNVATPWFILVLGVWYKLYQCSHGPVADYSSNNWAFYAVNCDTALAVGGDTFYIPTHLANVVPVGYFADYDPQRFTGLSDGDGIATGQDSSDNLTTYNLTQATSGKRPLYKTGVLNGKAVMRFDGVNDYLSASLPALTGNFALYLVVKQTAAADAALLGGSGSAPQFRVGQSANVLSTYDNSNNPQSSTLAVAQGNWMIVAFTRSGSTVTFWQALAGVATSYGTGTMSGDVSINELGAFVNGAANFLAGDAARVVLYGALQTTGEIATVVSTLYADYFLGAGALPLVGGGLVNGGLINGGLCA